MTDRARRWVVAGGLAICCAVWAILLAGPHVRGDPGPLDRWEGALFDLRVTTSGPVAPFADLVIVAIDDATLAAGDPLGPGRARMAEIVTAILDGGAAVLAVDILLLAPQDPEADRALAAALGRSRAVIAAARPGQSGGTEGFWPLPIFADVAEIGLVNITTDRRGVPRHMDVGALTPRGVAISLPVQAAALYLGQDAVLEPGLLRLGGRTIPLDTGGQIPLRIAGPNGTIPTLSAQALLAGSAGHDLRGKIVLLGVTATGLGDRFPTPFSPDLPGVEVLANAVSQILSATPLRRDMVSRRVDRGLAVALAVLCQLLVVLLPLAVGLPGALGALGLGLAATWVGLQWGVWMNAALLLASAGPPLILAAGLRYGLERRNAGRADRDRRVLRGFQAPALAERLARDPAYLGQPETRSLIICFADLTGFSALSETLEPARTQALLKGFHGAVTDIAERRGGLVLTFMGDGVLIAYGVLSEAPPRADDALRAAHEIVAETRRQGDRVGLQTPLDCRVGLHWGPAVLSRLGGARQQQISLSGEAVNLCSRLLEAARGGRTAIVATAEFMDRMQAAPHPAPTLRRAQTLRGLRGEHDLFIWPVDRT